MERAAGRVQELEVGSRADRHGRRIHEEPETARGLSPDIEPSWNRPSRSTGSEEDEPEQEGFVVDAADQVELGVLLDEISDLLPSPATA